MAASWGRLDTASAKAVSPPYGLELTSEVHLMMDYWRGAKFDELGSAARFSVDEKFRREAYRDITKIFLEIRKFNFKFRRA